jgi:hypothetical protein
MSLADSRAEATCMIVQGPGRMRQPILESVSRRFPDRSRRG